MSIFPAPHDAFDTAYTLTPTHGAQTAIHCDGRQCAVEETLQNTAYTTTTLKTIESATTAAVFIISSFLLFILLAGVRRFTAPFFRILTVLVTVIVARSIICIVLKAITLLLGVLIAYQNVITLVSDMLFKNLITLSIFLLALNRFAIIVYPTLDSLLFARYRYIILCLVCFAISSAETYVVITMSNLRRDFLPEIGFVDYIDFARPYEIATIISLAFELVSVGLHLMIIVYIRCEHQNTSLSTAKMQQRMFREIALMTLVNAIFTVLFIVLYYTPHSYESRIIIISFYNMLCFIPDILIPVFILTGSHEVHAEISSRFGCLKKRKDRLCHKTVTVI